MFRMFIHLFSVSTFLSFFILGFVIFLLILHKILQKKKKSLFLWRILCFLPLLLAIIHLIAFNFHYAVKDTFDLFGIVYFSSILIAIWQFFYDKKISYKVFTLFTLMICFMSFGLVYFNTIGKEELHNLSYYNYTDSFTKALEILKKEYVLNELKDIDYEYLYDKYYPLVEEAERNNDSQLFYKTLYEFSNEFKDGHFNFYVNMVSEEDFGEYRFLEDYENRDYGFGSILLNDGRFAAVLVDEKSEAYQKGLRDGMIILKKDGVELKQIVKDIMVPEEAYPVMEDDMLVKSLWLFSTGNDSVSLTFLDENNEEKKIIVNEVSKDNFKYRAREVYEKLFFVDYEQDNLTTKMLNEYTGYLYISDETYNEFLGALSYVTNKNTYLTKVLDKKLSDLKNAGMEKLIIDLRGNSGGYLTESAIIASFFTNDEYTFVKSSRYDSKLFDKTSISGNGKYADLSIIVLVDLNTVSAGDALVYLLSKNENVTIMGFTISNNSCQSVGGFIYLTDGRSYINYPTYKTYDMEDNVFIDTDYTGKANIKLDFRIPITEDSIKEIINSEKDYVLNLALYWSD